MSNQDFMEALEVLNRAVKTVGNPKNFHTLMVRYHKLMYSYHRDGYNIEEKTRHKAEEEKHRKLKRGERV